MTDLPDLATVERLAVRLGVTLAPGTADYARAEDAISSASVRARSVAEQPGWTTDNIPDDALDVVLAAAMRLYRNPDRFIANQAGSFQAILPTSDWLNGDIFLAADRRILENYRPTGGLWIAQTTREDGPGTTEPERATSYVADGINQGLGDPFYVGDAWSNGPW